MKKAVALICLVVGIWLIGAGVATAAKEYIVANRVFRVVDKNTKTKDKITLVANPQNAIEKPVTLCGFWEDTIKKPNKGEIRFDAVLETADALITGTETPRRRNGVAWACFTAPDDSIAVNDLAWIEITGSGIPKQKAADVLLLELNVGTSDQVVIPAAKRLGMTPTRFRALMKDRHVRMRRIELESRGANPSASP